jgi:diguanylate cyclase (GGDEF)-like protein
MRSRTSVVAAIILAALVVIGLLSFISIQASYASQLTTQQSKLASTAEVTADLIDEEMSSVKEVEQATLQQPAFIAAFGAGDPSTADLRDLQAVVDAVQRLQPEYQFAAVVNAQGIVRAIGPADPALVGEDFSYRDWFRGVTRTGSAYVSTGYVSAVKGAPLVVAIATQIHAPAPPGSIGTPTGPVVGVLYMGYKLGSLQAFADRLAALQHIDLQVTDQAGIILTRTGGISGRLTGAQRTPGLIAALAGRPTTAVSTTVVDAATPVGGIGWTVTASTPVAGTLAVSARNSSILIAIGLLVLLCCAGAATVLVIRRMERAQIVHAASAAELRTILEALTEAIQVFDADGGLVTRNDAARRTYELADDERTTDTVTPKWELLGEDGSPLEIAEGPLATSMRTGATSQSVVVGIRRRSDGLVRWLSISTVPIHGRSAKPEGYVSCARDISAQVETTRSLQVLAEAAGALSSSRVATQVMDTLSSAASELSSPPGELPRRAAVLMVAGVANVNPYVQQVIASREPLVAQCRPGDFGPVVGESVRASEVGNGALVPMIRDSRVFAIIAVAGLQHQLISDGQVQHLRTLATIGALAFSNADAHKRAESLARTDPLTGLGNRRALADRFAQLGRQRFAVVAIDVDNLKMVNDTHGHDAGDLLLAGVAQAMAKELRPADILVRTGGDEFVALLVDCDAHGATQLGRRLTSAVERVGFPWGTASVSLGTAAAPAGGDPIAVASAADQALYGAKHVTRSRRAVLEDVPLG